VSLQVAILKVLSGHPDGRASVADLKSDLAFLNSIGADWTDRLKRLAARAPALDIFGQGLASRDKDGWQLTAAGRELLAVMEAPDCAPQQLETKATAVPPVADQPAQVANVIDLEEHRRRRPAAFLELLPAQLSG
jgi:hypothetical protein